MHGRTATMRHAVTRKRREKYSKANKEAVLKELKDKRCLLTLDLKPFRY